MARKRRPVADEKATMDRRQRCLDAEPGTWACATCSGPYEGQCVTLKVAGDQCPHWKIKAERGSVMTSLWVAPDEL